MPEACLVILAKAPILGQVKSRLASEVGEDNALEVYGQLLTLTSTVVQQWRGRSLLLFDRTFRNWGPYGLDRFPRYAQARGGLGERMADAIRRGLEMAPISVVVGSDCPGLTIPILNELIEKIPEKGAAFGPASDGGFWGLATASAEGAEVIQNGKIPWSTAETLKSTESHLKEAGIATKHGPKLYNLVTATDLRRAIKDGAIKLELP
jgi:glycosyltransferase A (GT-A) superfamily protein (DUF2064 family)